MKRCGGLGAWNLLERLLSVVSIQPLASSWQGGKSAILESLCRCATAAPACQKSFARASGRTRGRPSDLHRLGGAVPSESQPERREVARRCLERAVVAANRGGRIPSGRQERKAGAVSRARNLDAFLFPLFAFADRLNSAFGKRASRDSNLSIPSLRRHSQAASFYEEQV